MKSSKLSKNEMKQVLGGVGSQGSTCSKTCPDGTTVSITCTASCYTDDKGAHCSTGETKSCEKKSISSLPGIDFIS